MRKAVAAALLAGAIGGGGFWYYRYSKTPTPPAVATAAVTRGDIVETVGATGTLQAVTTVQVGTQVSGTIEALGADYNSLVRKGQVIARLDPSLFRTQIEQARANLIRAHADLERLKVALADAQAKLNRARELSNRQLIPRTDLETADVNVQSAQAQIRSQEAQITQAQASLNQNQVNLEHTVITAPIDGLVISRNVDVGQTVAASMQAPTLFVLAADLTKMQVIANLDESDVGRIRPQQAVTFRVDAYPNDTFRGTVSQVRLEPKVQQNVVTYATVIDVHNDDLRLKPGMTANVNVEIARASGVLRVPNAALRFRPSTEVFAALGQAPPEPQGRGVAGNGATPAAGRSRTTGAEVRSGGIRPSDRAATTPPAVDARLPLDGRKAPQTEGSLGRGQPGPIQGSRPATAEAQHQPAGEGSVAAPVAGGGAAGGPRTRDRASSSGTQGPSAQRAGRADDAAPGAVPGAAAGTRRPQDAAPRQAGATTIDALFAPLPRLETVGRVWRFMANQLRPSRVRLGISDGQQTELIEGRDLDEGTELVTNVVLAGQSTRPAASAFPGLGGPGARGGFPGGGFQGGGGAGGGRGTGR